MATRETAIATSLARNWLLPVHNENELLELVQLFKALGRLGKKLPSSTLTVLYRRTRPVRGQPRNAGGTVRR